MPRAPKITQGDPLITREELKRTDVLDELEESLIRHVRFVVGDVDPQGRPIKDKDDGPGGARFAKPRAARDLMRILVDLQRAITYREGRLARRPKRMMLEEQVQTHEQMLAVAEKFIATLPPNQLCAIIEKPLTALQQDAYNSLVTRINFFRESEAMRTAIEQPSEAPAIE